MTKLQSPRRRLTTTAIFALAFFFAITLRQSAPAGEKDILPLGGLDPALAYQAERTDPVTHTVDFSAVVTPPKNCKKLRVWFPIPQSDFAQEVRDSRFTTFPNRVEPQIAMEQVYGNKFAYFEFANPRGAQVIRHRFTVKMWVLRWRLDPNRVERPDAWPDDFKPYLRTRVIAEQGRFDDLIGEISADGRPLAGLFGAMRWIETHLTYDHTRASLQADAEHAFTTHRGHCSDYHGLCAAMGRSLGYPTRVTYGLTLFPKNSPSHCKMEAYLPPYGWVSFDLSETQEFVKQIRESEQFCHEHAEELAAAARKRLQSGFRENCWLLVTKGTDYELAPPTSKPVRVVRTIYAEADGEPLPEPDPANPHRREFAWMTVHKYASDKPFLKPFEDIEALPEPSPRKSKHATMPE